LSGYAVKKVLKILAIIVGIFFTGLAYLQYQQIINMNWNKLQATSQNTVANATLQLSSRIGNTTDSITIQLLH
jgi:uncharacterized membrane protein (Fun14 family)